MNFSQINCFLAAAESLNFTKAAERLYLSQPGLSRQIAAMEREMGVVLFERGRNTVRLTEAGAVCAEYLTKIRFDYQKMLDEAVLTEHSRINSITIGGMEGQLVGVSYEDALAYFWSNSPNVKITMCYYSPSNLCKALVEGDVDIGILPENDAKNLPGILYKRSKVEKACLVVPSNHPKANMENPTLRDFKDETFLLLAESDSDAIASSHRRLCQEVGFTPKQHIVPTFGTLVMLLEMGVGISVLNTWHSLRHAPHLKFLKLPDLECRIEVVAWHKDNKNPNIPIFLSRVELEAE